MSYFVFFWDKDNQVHWNFNRNGESGCLTLCFFWDKDLRETDRGCINKHVIAMGNWLSFIATLWGSMKDMLQHCQEVMLGRYSQTHWLRVPTWGNKYLACPKLPCACSSVLAKVSRQRNREAWVLKVGSCLHAKEFSSLLQVNPEVGCVNMGICYWRQCTSDCGSTVHALGRLAGLCFCLNYKLFGQMTK